MKLTPAGSLMSRAMTVFPPAALALCMGQIEPGSPVHDKGIRRVQPGSARGTRQVYFFADQARSSSTPLAPQAILLPAGEQGRFDAADVFHPGRHTAVDSKYIAVTVNPSADSGNTVGTWMRTRSQESFPPLPTRR
jgi:hypothetical protein